MDFFPSSSDFSYKYFPSCQATKIYRKIWTRKIVHIVRGFKWGLNYFIISTKKIWFRLYLSSLIKTMLQFWFSQMLKVKFTMLSSVLNFTFNLMNNNYFPIYALQLNSKTWKLWVHSFGTQMILQVPLVPLKKNFCPFLSSKSGTRRTFSSPSF